MRLGTAHHTLAPPVPDHSLRDFRAWPVISIEWSGRQIIIELGTAGCELPLKSVKNLLGQPTRILLRLYHQRRHRADDCCLCHPAFAVARNVMHHFAAAGGVTNMHGVLEIEMRGQRREIVSIVIHVVAAAGLTRAAMAAAIMSDDTEALAHEEKHLSIPIVG